jgi:lysozyme
MLQYPQTIIARAIAQATGIANACEGCELEAYPDPGTGGEPWTIGRGSTRLNGLPVKPGDVISRAQADAMLQADLTGSCDLVMAYAPMLLNGDQLGALTSFMNNVGPGKPGVKDGFVWLKSGTHSTMYKMLLAGNFAGMALQFPYWVYGSGKPLPGLVKRRKLEAQVFTGQLDMTGLVA